MRVLVILALISAILCLPYTRLQYYYSLIVPIWLLFIICIIPKTTVTVLLIIILLVFYSKTLCIIFTLFGNAYTLCKYYPVKLRQDDLPVRTAVEKLFINNFKYTHNFHRIPSEATIYVANYVSDRIENIACILIPTKLCIIMGDGFIRNMKLDRIVKHVHGTKKTSGEYEEIKTVAEYYLKQGISLFSYSSRPFISDRIGKVRTGMFRIAKQLGYTITPIYFDHIKSIYGAIQNQRYSIVVGDTVYVDDVDQCVYNTKKFFRDTRCKLHRTKYESTIL